MLYFAVNLPQHCAIVTTVTVIHVAILMENVGSSFIMVIEYTIFWSKLCK